MHTTLIAFAASALVAFPFAATGMAMLDDSRPEAEHIEETVTVHKVKMVQDGSAYRFEPAQLTIKQGDQVKFVNVSGGPHNVAFDPEKIDDGVESTLAANMPDQIQPLAGALLNEAGASYTISFEGVEPGTYAYFCMPHMAMGMEASITVE